MIKLSGKNLFLTFRRFTGLLLMLATIIFVLAVSYCVYMAIARFICIALIKIVEIGETSFSSWI